jgi:hypothetical protein
MEGPPNPTSPYRSFCFLWKHILRNAAEKNIKTLFEKRFL